MTNLINRIFSNKYANHKAIGDNLLLLLMYRFSFPFAFALHKFGLTPNQITTTSTLFAILAAGVLIIENNKIFFVVFWSMSILLDFCDGTVARMSGNTSKTALRYDHMSDLFKIFIIMLATGVYYDSLMVWIFTMTASFLFSYYMLFNHELNSITKLSEEKINMPTKVNDKITETTNKLTLGTLVKKIIPNEFLLKLLKGLYIAFTTINGHTLLLFLIVPFGSKFVLIGFSYFMFLSLIGVVTRISALRKIPR